jgi:UDP-glucose 4-epimerase
MKKLLITGGAGYIGSHTAVAASQCGFIPVIVDNLSNSQLSQLDGIQTILNQKLDFHLIDCCDELAMRKVFQQNDFCGVIHFAAFKSVAESVEHPDKYYQNNLKSLEVVLKLVAEFDVPNFIFSSSSTVYGEPDKNPVTELAPMKKAESPYGHTKQLGEEMIADWHKITAPSVNVIILRYFNPIGAHESGLIGELPLGKPNNLVPILTRAAVNQTSVTIFGSNYNTPDGTCIRDYIHVCDLAEAHTQSLTWCSTKSNIHEIFNVGQGSGNSVKEVMSDFCKYNNINLNIIVGDRRAGDVEQIWSDPLKINSILGWKSKRTTQQALIDAWRFQISQSN